MRLRTRILASIAMVVVSMAAPSVSALADQGTDVIVLKTVTTPSTRIASTIGDTEYGAVLYSGVASWQGETVQIERRVTFRYTKGTGPAGGFLTLVWPDGSQIAMEGGGYVNAGPEFSDIFVVFNVFAASGRWKGYTGIARQDCTRRGGVEAKSACTYVVKVHKG